MAAVALPLAYRIAYLDRLTTCWFCSVADSCFIGGGSLLSLSLRRRETVTRRSNTERERKAPLYMAFPLTAKIPCHRIVSPWAATCNAFPLSHTTEVVQNLRVAVFDRDEGIDLRASDALNKRRLKSERGGGHTLRQMTTFPLTG